MEKDRNNYSSIFKAIGLFGGVKVFQIIITVLRSKVIALLIGPSGMGVIGLLQSSIEVVNQVTGCGIQTTAVREISHSLSKGDTNSIRTTVTTMRRLVWITGLLGTVVVLFLSNRLSVFAFGNSDYSNAFKILSIVLLLTQLSIGQIALLQGTFHYREMAKASVYGSGVSLVCVCPLYYFWGENGIVPSLIVTAAVSLFFSWLYSRKNSFKNVHMKIGTFISKSKGMVSLGIALAAGTALSTASGYLMNLYLSTTGGTAVVGLYQAACQVANSYFLLVLSAMAADYIPRLSSLNDNSNAQIEVINKQAIMVLIIISPLLAVLMLFAKEVVLLLYSSEFYAISGLISIIMFGLLFRAVSWCLSYSLIAKGESKWFLICEATTCLSSLALKIVGYLIGGFVGMGIGFVANYVLYTFILWLITKRSFGFSFDLETKKVFLEFLVLLSVCVLVCFLPFVQILKYITGLIVVVLISALSYRELNLRVDLKGTILMRFKKNGNNKVI